MGFFYLILTHQRGHAIFLDARAFLQHLPQEAFPAKALAIALYVEEGIRAMERGIVWAERNKRQWSIIALLFRLRLTIPRSSLYRPSSLVCCKDYL